MATNSFILLGILCCISYAIHAYDIKCVPQPEKDLAENSQESVLIYVLNKATNLLEEAKQYASVITSAPVRDETLNKAMDCAGILEKDPCSKSGIYNIWPRNRISTGPVAVYCDMEDDGGAWTVIQRRGDFDSDADYFYKDWKSYKSGFGDLQKDFWLGNDNIYCLTNQRANIVKFTLTDWQNDTKYAIYDEFWIEDEFRNYTLHTSGYRGSAGDSFSYGNESPFSTKDRDNDKHEKHCSITYKGAWWYVKCYYSNLNGIYLKDGGDSNTTGLAWFSFKGNRYSLKDTIIKIRPKGINII